MVITTNCVVSRALLILRQFVRWMIALSTVFAHACQLGAEVIVSKRVGTVHPIQSMPRLDQGPNPATLSVAAGAERDLE